MRSAGMASRKMRLSRRALLLTTAALPASALAEPRNTPGPVVPHYGPRYGTGGRYGPQDMAATGPALDLNFLSGTLDPRISFSRAAGLATYFDATGTLQTAANGAPRFDYDPVSHFLSGLLIEEARTNL